MNGSFDSDERAAARAFLQRCDVRLSTVHRVATALLSGAGLMVLLPAMIKDQIVEVVGTLVASELTIEHVVLSVVAMVVLALPLVVFFLLLGDLTRFYFHGEHFSTDAGTAFAPRFTLSGLRMSIDELGETAARELDAARAEPSAVELLVPPNPQGRASIDAKLAAYQPADGAPPRDDLERASGLFALVASRPRTLAEEVAKIEFGMARHLLRLQIIVMRYVKALLAFLVTALAVVAAAAVVTRDAAVGVGSELWLAGIFAVWAPIMVLAVSSPVRWVEGLLRAEGATANPITADPEFTRFERIAIRVGALVLALATAALGLGLAEDASPRRAVTAGVVVAVSFAAFAFAARRSVAEVTVSRR